jgi:hypothetical protein
MSYACCARPLGALKIFVCPPDGLPIVICPDCAPTWPVDFRGTNTIRDARSLLHFAEIAARFKS